MDQIIEGSDNSKELKGINSYFARQMRPKDFMSDVSDEIKHERAFELNCIILSELTNKPVKEMTTKEYFALLDYRNEQIRQKNGRQSY